MRKFVAIFYALLFFTIGINVHPAFGWGPTTEVRVTELKALPATGAEKSPVSFSASAYVTGCSIASYTWNFGDGTIQNQNTSSGESNISHTFESAGSYNVQVTVLTGTSGVSDTKSITYSVLAAPTVTPTPTSFPSPSVSPAPTVTLSPSVTVTPTQDAGASGGGCSAGFSADSVLLLLFSSPLFFLLLRR